MQYDGLSFRGRRGDLKYKRCLDARRDISYPDADFYGDKIYLTYDRERTGAKEILFLTLTEEDIVNPTRPSCCPDCQQTLSPAGNLPIQGLSWLAGIRDTPLRRDGFFTASSEGSVFHEGKV